jgi:hypothetical protein
MEMASVSLVLRLSISILMSSGSRVLKRSTALTMVLELPIGPLVEFVGVHGDRANTLPPAVELNTPGP